MMKWVWHCCLAAVSAFSALFVACSENTSTAGSSFETENSIAMTVMSGSAPAAYTKVIVRPQDYLAGASSRVIGEDENADSASGIFNRMTDGRGQLNLPKMKAGNYVVEARGEDEKAFARISVKDSVCDSISLNLAKTTSVSGQVLMPVGVKSVRVGISGLDYFVQTDSLGKFEFASLPTSALPEDSTFNAVGFIFSSYDYVDMNGESTTFDSFQTLGVAVVPANKDSVEKVYIGYRPSQIPVEKDTVEKDTVKQDTIPQDTTAVDTIPEDTISTYLMLDDFENDTYGWYSSVSRNATVELNSVDEGKFGLVAHMTCHKDSNVVWTMMGHNFSKFYDFSTVDSVRFWVRGDNPNGDSMWVSLSFDVHVYTAADSLLGYETGKAWAHKPVTDKWTRVVVTPDDLEPADEHKMGGNIGWDAVKDHINSIGIFSALASDEGNYELWVDDVEIFGVVNLAP